MSERPLNLFLLACYFKGERFMLQAHARGAKVYLLTWEGLKNRPWPLEAITELHTQADKPQLEWTLNTVSYIARRVRIDRLIGLDDYDIEVAAHLREHLRLPGMSESTARFFRDKLACRIKAKAEGLPVPEFTPVFNDEEVAEFTQRVPGPWMLKPRSEASATGIHKVESVEQLWELLHSKGDGRSYYLLEQYLPGDVYHVDALTADRKVVFAEAHRNGTPPFNVAHGGGIFTTMTLERGTKEEKELKALNEKVLTRLGLERGASHVEFIKAKADGRFYLLETAARVGGAHIAETVEASTGVNLWAEWANIEIDAALGKPYKLPQHRQDYGGLLMTLAKQEFPDMSGFDAPEVKYRAPERNHAGLVLASPKRERIGELVDDYQTRFQQEFMLYLPPAKRPAH